MSYRIPSSLSTSRSTSSCNGRIRSTTRFSSTMRCWRILWEQCLTSTGYGITIRLPSTRTCYCYTTFRIPNAIPFHAGSLQTSLPSNPALFQNFPQTVPAVPATGRFAVISSASKCKSTAYPESFHSCFNHTPRLWRTTSKTSGMLMR